MQFIVGSSLLFVGTVLLGIFMHIRWQCKFALRSRGFPVYFHQYHWRDFNMLDRAVTEESDPGKIEHLRLIQHRMKSSRIMGPLALVTLCCGTVLLITG